MKKIISLLLLSLIAFTACQSTKIQPAENSNADDTNANQSMVEPSQDDKQVVAAPIIPPNIDTPAPSEKIATVNDVLQKSTYLIGKVLSQKESADQYCRSDYSEFFDKNTASDLSKQVEDFLVKNKDFTELLSVCKKGENIYLLFPSQDGSYSVSLWENKNNFKFFESEGKYIDYFGGDGAVTSFITDGESGNSLVYSISKDVPDVYWRISILDPKTMQSSLAEKCTLKFEYDKMKALINIDKYTLTCDKEYKP